MGTRKWTVVDVCVYVHVCLYTCVYVCLGKCILIGMPGQMHPDWDACTG